MTFVGKGPAQTRSRVVVSAVLLAGALVVVGSLWLFASQGDESGAPASSGVSVADVSFEAFDGEGTVELSRFLGRPLVLNYWASWCLPCVAEMPDFQTVYEDVGDRVAFLGVNLTDTTDQARRLVDQTGVRYELARDPEGDRFQKLGALGMPTTFFVDEEGRVVERFTGSLDALELRNRIEHHFGI